MNFDLELCQIISSSKFSFIFVKNIFVNAYIYIFYTHKQKFHNRKITQWIEFQNQLSFHFVYPAAFYQILKPFIHFCEWTTGEKKKKKKISRSFRLSFRILSSYFTYFRFLLIYIHTRTHMDRGNIYRGN